MPLYVGEYSEGRQIPGLANTAFLMLCNSGTAPFYGDLSGHRLGLLVQQDWFGRK